MSLTPMTRVRIEGRIKGMEEAKHVVGWAVKDRAAFREIATALDIRIAEMRRQLEAK